MTTQNRWPVVLNPGSTQERTAQAGDIPLDGDGDALVAASTGSGAPTPDYDSADTAGIGRTFVVGSQWIDETTGDVYVCTNASAGAAQWQSIGGASGLSASTENNGFVDGPDGGSDIAYDEATRTFTLAATSDYRVNLEGQQFLVTEDMTVTHANTEGMHYFYLSIVDDELVLETAQTFPNLLEQNIVAYVLWNADDEEMVSGLFEERHTSAMDARTHVRLHRGDGTKYYSGFALSYEEEDENNAAVRVTGGQIGDEDLTHTIVHAASPSAAFEQNLGTGTTGPTGANLPVFYLGPNGETRIFYQDPADGYWPFAYDGATDFPYYNPLNGGSGLWELLKAAPPSTDHLLYWLCASNNREWPVFLKMGHRADSSPNNGLRDLGISSINWGTDNPFEELTVLYRIMLRTRSAYKPASPHGAAVFEVLDLRSTSGGGAAANLVPHGGLSGLAYEEAGHSGFQKRITGNAGVPGATFDDEAGYEVYDMIYDTTGGALYICTDNTTGAAVWAAV